MANDGGGSSAVAVALITAVGAVLAAFIGILPSLGLFDQGEDSGGVLPGYGSITDGGSDGDDNGGSGDSPAQVPPDVGDLPGPASLFLSETSAPAGAVVNVSGEGFDPGERVTIRVHTDEVGSTEVDDAGRFTNVAITVPESLGAFAPSRFSVTATGASSVRHASKQIMVSG